MVFHMLRDVLYRPLEINNKEIEKIVGHIDFYSATYRLWKIPELEPDCEDYGQVLHSILSTIQLLDLHSFRFEVSVTVRSCRYRP